LLQELIALLSQSGSGCGSGSWNCLKALWGRDGQLAFDLVAREAACEEGRSKLLKQGGIKVEILEGLALLRAERLEDQGIHRVF
jgi:hypothetical protein